jgi:hypothetical protein
MALNAPNLTGAGEFVVLFVAMQAPGNQGKVATGPRMCGMTSEVRGKIELYQSVAQNMTLGLSKSS